MYRRKRFGRFRKFLRKIRGRFRGRGRRTRRGSLLKKSGGISM